MPRTDNLDVEAMTLIRRLTLIVGGGRLEKGFYPVFPPDKNAAEAIVWLAAHSASPATVCEGQSKGTASSRSLRAPRGPRLDWARFGFPAGWPRGSATTVGHTSRHAGRAQG